MIHSEIIKHLTETVGSAKWDEKALAVVEIDDLSAPYLVIEVLEWGGDFHPIFEFKLSPLDESAEKRRFQIPIILRVSMKGQPVASVGSTDVTNSGNVIPQIDFPEHSLGT